VLSIASVIGRDFAVDVLQRMGGITEDELLSALEEATKVSLIEELRGQRELRYRFTHAFFRQTLYEEMIAPRRLRMHNEVAKALEAHYSGRLEEHAAELAEHYAHSSGEEDLRRAVAYGEIAAAKAASVYAFGEASRLVEQAIQVQEIVEPGDAETLYRLFMILNGCLLPAGETARILNESAPKAYELAEKLGAGPPAANVAEIAVWALIYQHGTLAFVQPEYRSWCDRMDENAAPDSRERVVADDFLSWIYWFARDQERCWQLRRDALDLARRLGNDEALALAVFTFVFDGAPQKWDQERLQVARDAANIPRVGLPPNLTSQYFYGLLNNLISGGDRESYDQYRAELDRYAQRIDEPYVYLWQKFVECQHLQTIGELEKTVTGAQELLAGTAARGIALFGQLMTGYVSQPALESMGRFDEMDPLPGVWPTLPYGDAINARQLAVVGRRDEAEREVRRIISEQRIGDDDWAPDITLVCLLDAAVLTGDAESAAQLYKRLAGAESWYARGAFSTVARPMGLAASLLGDQAAARSLLQRALEVAGKVGNRPDAARTHAGLARVLFEHYPDERSAAAEHLNEATREAQAMKMKPLLDECLALKLKFQGITSTDLNTSIDTVARVVREEKPDLRSHAAPDGTVTLMFSDIEDSTVLTESLGDNAWQELLRKHNALIREQIKAHDGFEVKTMGDGFMVAFQSAKKGLDCAIAIQRAFAAHNAADGQHVKVRIGLHAGEAIKEGDDFYGKNVIMASRVAGKANGGEILVSSLLRSLVESSVGAGVFGEPREVELKGLSGTHTVFAVQ
jgi:class 3 adenylate cyclase